MAFQTMIMAYLICAYSGKSASGIGINIAYLGLLYFLVFGGVTKEQLKYLQMSNVPLIVASRLIQV